MEIWKGAKPAGVLSEETRDKPILSGPGLLMCMLYMYAKKDGHKKQVSFHFFTPTPSSSFLQKRDTSCIPMYMQTYSYFGQPGIRAQV